MSLIGRTTTPAPIEVTLVRLACRPVGKWAAKRVLLGRSLDRNHAAKGRITRAHVDRILARTWQNYDQLAPRAQVDRLQTRGNRQNVLLGVFSLAVYRALLAEGIEQRYATELVADLAWKVYENWVTVPRLIARLLRRDPQEQMNLMLRMFLRFPFSRPGYDWRAHTEDGALALDFYRCPVRDFLHSQGEEEFMLGTWCSLDFALAQVMVKGGRYQRPHTLSAGDRVCDMKWYASEPHAAAGSERESSAATPARRENAETVSDS
jgi:hypothetical protein